MEGEVAGFEGHLWAAEGAGFGGSVCTGAAAEAGLCGGALSSCHTPRAPQSTPPPHTPNPPSPPSPKRYDNAWWKVVLESRSQNSVVVRSPSYGSRHRAPLTHIRPRFAWTSPNRGWAYAQGQAQMELPVTDVLMAHQRPLPSHPQRGGEKRAAAATARVRSKAGGGRGGRGRGGRAAKGRGGAALPAAPCPVLVGEILEVEVAEDEDQPEKVSWAPSEVRLFSRSLPSFLVGRRLCLLSYLAAANAFSCRAARVPFLVGRRGCFFLSGAAR